MAAGPILLCYDGSDRAGAAITAAAEVLASRDAVVVTVWEPLATWQPYDPAGVISAGVAKLGTESLGLDEIARDVGREMLDRGVELARGAGFNAAGRLVGGKTWRAICDLADDLDASAIVLGARGLSRVQSMLLGSVSSAVAVHAHRPVLVIPTPEHDHAHDHDDRDAES